MNHRPLEVVGIVVIEAVLLPIVIVIFFLLLAVALVSYPFLKVMCPKPEKRIWPSRYLP